MAMAERKNLLRSIRENFFLRKHIPSESTIKILKDLYPGVNWKRVDFYEGLPWFTSTIAPYVSAQALPNFYSLSRFRIYVTKFDESRAQCLADIVHEGFHVMQAMRFLNGYGLGFFRGFMFYYIAVFLKQGYRQNAFEVPAYDQEFRFLDYCAKRGLHGIVPKVHDHDLTGISNEPSLVFSRFEFRYRENFILLAGSFLFCSVVSIIKPIVDALLFIIFFPAAYAKR
jgi:hypothetical protein